MLKKSNKFAGFILCGIIVIVYIIFMAGTGRVFDSGNSTVVLNTDDESEYKIGNISNEREYAIVINKEINNISNVSLKILDMQEKYKEDYRNNGIISVKFYNNETGEFIGEKYLNVQDILLRAHYAKESSDASIEYTGIACNDLNINVSSLKIVIVGKNITQDSEIVLYGNRQDRIENMSSFDDGVLINGNILCNITQGKKKISTDFVWGFILIVVVGITMNFLKMKNDGGFNGKEHN